MEKFSKFSWKIIVFYFFNPMIDKYYQEQLEILHTHAKLFSQRYPALAPMLAESGSDPDVERLLEGTAYLSARIQQRLENGVPELIQSLLRLTFPDVLNPIPSTTLIQFKTNSGFTTPSKVPAGTSINSIMVGGTSCVYNTEFDLNLLPLEVKCLGIQQTENNQAKIVVKVDSLAKNFQNFFNDKNDYSLRLHCGGDYFQAVARFQTILENTEYIELYQNAGQQKKILPINKHLKISTICFANNQLQFNFNYEMGINLGGMNFHQQHVLGLKRYLHLPQQLLFFDVYNLTPNILNSENINNFELHFVLKKSAKKIPDFIDDSFLPNVVSAVNLFEQSAEPIIVDQSREEYAVRPQDEVQKYLEIIHITKVEALLTGGKIERYYPFELFTPNLQSYLYSIRYKIVNDYLSSMAYSNNNNNNNSNSNNYKNKNKNIKKDDDINNSNNILNNKISELNRSKVIFLLTLLQPPKTEFNKQTLSINLICCNHTLPKQLRVGDICIETDNSPAQATFKNIVNPTAPIGRIVDSHLLWRFISLLSCNLLSLASLDSLKSLLYLYLPQEFRGQDIVSANTKRIESLVEFHSEISERLFKGQILHGRNLHISIEETNFLNRGDMYLFAIILDNFFAGFAPLNSYTQLFLKVIPSGELIEFAPRLGSKKLF